MIEEKKNIIWVKITEKERFSQAQEIIEGDYQKSGEICTTIIKINIFAENLVKEIGINISFWFKGKEWPLVMSECPYSIFFVHDTYHCNLKIIPSNVFLFRVCLSHQTISSMKARLHFSFVHCYNITIKTPLS